MSHKVAAPVMLRAPDFDQEGPETGELDMPAQAGLQR